MNIQEILTQISNYLKKNRADTHTVKVVIDPGHGGYDLGLKTGKKYNKGYNDILEKDINLEVSTRLLWLCMRHGIGAILTRWGDRFISLNERCRVANMTKSKLFLSIHCNYAKKSQYRGIETWFYGSSSRGKVMARRCQNLLVDLRYTDNRGIKDGEFFVLRKTKMPAILVELGFLSNGNDTLYLNNEENQMLIAERLLQFIKEVCL